MHQGGVKLQTLAIFTETTPGSSQRGLLQANAFKALPKEYPGIYYPIREDADFERFPDPSAIGICLAIENASSFAEEDDDLDSALKALERIHKKVGKVVYVSFTWNMENRFGGGAHTAVGLKSDGKHLLEALAAHNIAVDLSHASDRLAYEIFDYIDKHNLAIKVIASHSVMRAIYDVPRNLPDEIAKEIIKRGGVIGLNFIAKFIGSNMNQFLKHLDRLLMFGGSDSVCFGADFFYEDDIPESHRSPEKLFFDDYGDASTYPKLLAMIRKELKLPEEIVTNLASGNLVAFLRKSAL
jgi:microsomal dipeptidase-like Zn-dependent dipeptidase